MGWKRAGGRVAPTPRPSGRGLEARDALFSDPPRLTTTHGRRALAALTAVALLLGACGEGTPESLDQTVAHAQDSSATAVERCDAVRSLVHWGEEAVVPLRALVKVRNDRVAECALQALARVHDPKAVEALAALLDDRNPAVVRSVTTALGRIGDPAAVRPLVGLLGSGDRKAVVPALTALAAIGDPRAVPAIGRLALHRGATPAADQDGRAVRRAAVAALGNLGDRGARPTLVTVLRTDPTVARSAGTALARIYRKDVRPLLTLLDDAGSITLAYALVDVGQKGTEDALETALLTYGGLDLAEYYLNCGNHQLENAAETWADQHGYTVYSTPSYGSGGGQWGSGV